MSTDAPAYRKARLISALTLASRILGVVRDAVCSRMFGVGVVWDAFALGFMLPNLFRRLFGEGALAAAFIPVYTRLKETKGQESANRLARTTLWTLVAVLAGLTLIGEGVILLLVRFYGQEASNLLALRLAGLMLPYNLLICTVALLGAILQVHHRFGPPAFAPIILNLCMISAAGIIAPQVFTSADLQIFVLAAAVLTAGIIQIAAQLPALRAARVDLKPLWDLHNPALRRLGRLMGPMVAGLAVVQLNTLMDSMLAWWLSTPQNGPLTFQLMGHSLSYPLASGAVSVLYYAQRLYQFPLALFGIALATALFPLFSRQAARKEHHRFADSVARGLRLTLFIGLPAGAGLILVGKPLIQLLFEGRKFTAEATDLVHYTLTCYAVGIWAYCAQHVLVRACYALEDSRGPLRIAAGLVGLNLILNLAMVWPMGTGGFALSTAICAILQVALLVRLLRKRIAPMDWRTVVRSAGRSLIAAAVMFTICYAAKSILSSTFSPGRLTAGIILTACLILGAGGYYLAARMLKMKELSELLPSRKTA